MYQSVYVVVLLVVLGGGLEAQSLRGSRASMSKQFNKAKELDLTRLKNKKEVKRFVGLNLLHELDGNKHYEVDGARYPYSRPTVKLFVERLSQQHYTACGERMVVTSLTRPLAEQPRNASKRSVHPAGLSVDFRISKTTRCRLWLERTLLSLEKVGVLEATKERRPPHYHVAVFPDKYQSYLAAKAKRAKKPVARRR